MGNNIPSKSSNTRLSELMKTHPNKTKNKFKSSEHFIIKHSHDNKDINESITSDSLDQRRVVFISLLGIYQCWRRTPSVILYSSIFLMPLKRKWVLNPSQYTQELQSHFISKLSTFYDSTETNEFMQLLLWKERQGLVVWMLNDYNDKMEKDNNNSLIDPFWHYLNDMLMNLYDPITGLKYNKLHLNAQWWSQDSKNFITKYNTKSSSILSELYFLTMKFNTMQEILFQSNPLSLNPIRIYPISYEIMPDNVAKTSSSSSLKSDFVKSADDVYMDDEEKENYVFCEDYDHFCEQSEQTSDFKIEDINIDTIEKNFDLDIIAKN